MSRVAAFLLPSISMSRSRSASPRDRPRKTSAVIVAGSVRVDFWIGDVDEAAGKAAELGGRVIEGPYDVPGVGMRQAVIADPQGAIFSLTRPPGVG